MLEVIKLALRIVEDAFDFEIEMLYKDAICELESLGIKVEKDAMGTPTDPQVRSAIISYVKWKFGNNPDSDKSEKIYHEKVGQMQIQKRYING